MLFSKREVIKVRKCKSKSYTLKGSNNKHNEIIKITKYYVLFIPIFTVIRVISSQISGQI